MKITNFIFKWIEYVIGFYKRSYIFSQEVCEDDMIKDVEYSPTTKKLVVRLKDEMTRWHTIDPNVLNAIRESLHYV